MDDGQVSLAETGGGIGMHVDDYDVFPIQMSGSRTWRVGRNIIDAREERDGTIDGMDVRVLRDDRKSDDDNVDNGDGEAEGGGGGKQGMMDEFVVHPGYVLYLSPRVAHCGTSLSDDLHDARRGMPGAVRLGPGVQARRESVVLDGRFRGATVRGSGFVERCRRLLRCVVVDASSSSSSSLSSSSGRTMSPGELTSDAKEHATREGFVGLVD